MVQFRRAYVLVAEEGEVERIQCLIMQKGKTMSRYGDSDYDDMFYELDEFLKSHKPSELLKLVQEVVEWWEERTDEAD